ncbi:MAG: leucine-rich repeat protein [Oscillospiraceae bacterium]|nr:leucine-rich repeat protein [Oscillospiraceae bacterium]
MQSSLKKIISGAVCMAFTLSSVSLLESVIADAVNIENVAPVSATASGTLENGLEYEVYEDYVEITKCDTSAGGELIIPDTIDGLPVTSIGAHAFIEFRHFESVTIPYSITNIENIILSTKSSFPLTGIHVDPENQYYMDINGILFSKDQKKLISYPAGKSNSSYSVPDSVTSIGNGAFNSCSSLTSVTIPDSVTSIEGSAFSACSALASITIPGNVETIKSTTFYNCSALESITILNPDCEIDDKESTISDTVVIYGYPDSTAQAYAKRYDRKFIALNENQDTTDSEINPGILWGDANDNGEVDISDVVLMNRVYVGVDEISEKGLANADVDQSGKIELADSMNVLKLLVHLLEESDFPIKVE